MAPDSNLPTLIRIQAVHGGRTKDYGQNVKKKDSDWMKERGFS